jgi:hypothetical protein
LSVRPTCTPSPKKDQLVEFMFHQNGGSHQSQLQFLKCILAHLHP